MPDILKFEELDFYNSSDNETLSDGDPWDSLEKSEEIELPDDIDFPSERIEPPSNPEDSLFDSLLGEALTGEVVEESEDNEEEEEEENDDSAIGTSVSNSNESQVEIESPAFDLGVFLQFMKDEESTVEFEDIPDFASKKNVYGTSFNVLTGKVLRPPRFEFKRADADWIEYCKIVAFDEETSLKKLLSLPKTEQVEEGSTLEFEDCKFTDVYYRTASEMEEMETHHIQKIICDAFNSKRLAVIFLGVDADRKIMGCKLDPTKQDHLRLALDTAIQTEFTPKIENILDAIDVCFVPVKERIDTFLAVIRVKQIRNQEYRLEFA